MLNTFIGLIFRSAEKLNRQLTHFFTTTRLMLELSVTNYPSLQCTETTLCIPAARTYKVCLVSFLLQSSWAHNHFTWISQANAVAGKPRNAACFCQSQSLFDCYLHSL